MAQGVLPIKYEAEKKYKTAVEWAEVCYVPNAIGHSRKGPEYRYLAKRKVLDNQQELPGMDLQIEIPFPMAVDFGRWAALTRLFLFVKID